MHYRWLISVRHRKSPPTLRIFSLIPGKPLSPTHPSSHSTAQSRKSFGENCTWTLFSHLMKDVLQAKYAAALTNLILKRADTLQKTARIVSVTSVQSSAHHLLALFLLNICPQGAWIRSSYTNHLQHLVPGELVITHSISGALLPPSFQLHPSSTSPNTPISNRLNLSLGWRVI